MATFTPSSMRRLFSLAALIITSTLTPAASAIEGAPSLIDYQGSALDDQGNPLAPTTPALYKMEFRIWDQIGGGNLIWSEQQTVTVFKGQFSVRLGEGSAATDTVPPLVPQGQLPLAFEGSSRFLGVTIVTNPAAKVEITPRLSFLTTPYAHVANTASVVVQQAGTSSSIMIGSIGYAIRKEDSDSATVNLTLDQRTNLIAAGPTGTVANLPVGGDNHELLISKTDDTPQFVTIAPPAGGQINGSTSSIRLKVKGESVTLQNAGGNVWWIVDDTRDNTPVGTIISYGSETPPPGYLPCDGQKLLRAAHEDLFTSIGTTWGNPGPTEFNLPDLTGRFLRGSNDDFAVGVIQTDTLREHSHAIKDKGHDHGAGGAQLSMSVPTGQRRDDGDNPYYSPGGSGSSLDVTPTPSVSVANSSSNLTLQPFGGKETRPDNAGVRYCVKY